VRHSYLGAPLPETPVDLTWDALRDPGARADEAYDPDDDIADDNPADDLYVGDSAEGLAAFLAGEEAGAGGGAAGGGGGVGGGGAGAAAQSSDMEE
jgi:hypothetical protein